MGKELPVYVEKCVGWRMALSGHVCLNQAVVGGTSDAQKCLILLSATLHVCHAMIWPRYHADDVPVAFVMASCQQAVRP